MTSKIFPTVGKWIKSLFCPKYKSIFVEENIPNKLKSKILYVITEENEPWHVALLCPCGCKEVLQMNLIPDEHPVWKLQVHKNGTPTLHPSVWRKKGCQAHFWLQKGHIIWCYSSVRSIHL